MIVTGKVVQVSSLSTITILVLNVAGRNSPFTAVIFRDNLRKFNDLQKLQGQEVEVTGTFTEDRNKPEIILESPDQIKVVDEK